jgi:hypothetical protein
VAYGNVVLMFQSRTYMAKVSDTLYQAKYSPNMNDREESQDLYLKACLDQRRHLSPFAGSMDGVIGHEAKMMLKLLSALLAVKWSKPYSTVCGYVNPRMSIAITGATHSPMHPRLSYYGKPNQQLSHQPEVSTQYAVELIANLHTYT